MPLVKVRYRDTVPEAVLKGLGSLLCAAVAEQLTCNDDGGQLTPNDIEVQFDACSPYDVVLHDLTIDVEAMHFPLRDKGDPDQRESDFETRVWRIREDLVSAIPIGNTFGLWVKLSNAQWAEGESTGRPLAGFQSGM